MDTHDFETLKQRLDHASINVSTAHVFEGIEEFSRKGVPYFAEFSDRAAFEEVVEFLGLSTIHGRRVMGYAVENLESGDLRDSEERQSGLLFDDEQPLWVAFVMLAETQNVWEEEPNDFRATFAVRYDDTTVITLGQEMHDVSDGVQLEIASKYWMGIVKAEDFEDCSGWRGWDLTNYNHREYKARQDALAMEREQKEGVTNLSRLHSDDVLCITTKLSDNDDDISQRIRTRPNDEPQPRFYDEFIVIEEGSQPICAVNGTDHKIRLSGGGSWTTRKQNPVQHQDRAFTPSYGYIYPGQHILMRSIDTNEMSVSDTIVDSIQINPNKEPSS